VVRQESVARRHEDVRPMKSCVGELFSNLLNKIGTYMPNEGTPIEGA